MPENLIPVPVLLSKQQIDWLNKLGGTRNRSRVVRRIINAVMKSKDDDFYSRLGEER